MRNASRFEVTQEKAAVTEHKHKNEEKLKLQLDNVIVICMTPKVFL